MMCAVDLSYRMQDEQDEDAYTTSSRITKTAKSRMCVCSQLMSDEVCIRDFESILSIECAKYQVERVEHV